MDRRIPSITAQIETQPDVSIPKLARSVNLSASRLEHLWRTETGSCLRDQMELCRMHHAAGLLTNTELSVKEIGYDSGYSHTSSFCRAFRRHFLIAPSIYRKSSPRGNSSERETGNPPNAA
jgi:AraC family transcriptional regulator, arabinose operon regulatory protein